ncbi:sugar phosphate isomerase/epimerase family protein [Paraglaciecola sp.]|uniref:sugar phosphate isomerase/epimerase family protein n=1 Tax=Paraglaciecola sp. TaxID=1920173 RepID=UPI003EF91842
MRKIILSCYLALTLVGLTACSSTQTNKADSIQVPPVSVQLWSVKNALKADFKGTLENISEMGFSGVEFAGNFGSYANDPEGLKTYLASIGLKASGAHVGFKHLRGDKLAPTLDFYQKLGAELIIIPADGRAWSADGVADLTKELTALSVKLAEKGLLMGYHNHDMEFDSFEGSTYWDYIAQNTPKSVFLQLDVGWVNFAKQNAVEYVKKYAGRTLTTHIKIRTYKGKDAKETGKSPFIGQDSYDWATLIKTQMEHGGTRWLVLEQEEYPNGLNEVESVAKSKLGLDKIIQSL